MTRTLVAAWLATFCLATSGADLLVTNATLWTDSGPRAEREILVRDGRVVRTARAGTIEAASGARVIDAHGDTLLPGLIDAHVHLVSGLRVPEEFGAQQRARVAALQLLRSGVTSGRVHLWGLASVQQFSGEGPRLVFGGPGLFGGQPDWYLGLKQHTRLSPARIERWP